MERWRGKVAIVTGACSGMGAAVGEALVEHGLQVIGLTTHVELIEENAKKLSSKPGKLHAFKLDITNESQISAEISSAFIFAESIGPVHVLISNIVSYDAPLNFPGKRKVLIGNNMQGLYIVCLEVLKHMHEAGVDGHIVHISSNYGHKVDKSTGQYGPGKQYHDIDSTWIYDNLMKELNKDGNKIKFSTLRTGTLETEFLGSCANPEMLRIMPKLKSEDVVSALLYILGTAPHVQVRKLKIKPTGESI